MSKPIPFEFVLEALDRISPYTKQMFGCTAVYVQEKIVLVLRNRSDFLEDNGVWLATTTENHESLKAIFPSMRSLKIFGTKQTGWQVLPVESEDFEESVNKACDLILAKDPRIGKVPKTRVGKRGVKRKRSTKRRT